MLRRSNQLIANRLSGVCVGGAEHVALHCNQVECNGAQLCFGNPFLACQLSTIFCCVPGTGVLAHIGATVDVVGCSIVGSSLCRSQTVLFLLLQAVAHCMNCRYGVEVREGAAVVVRDSLFAADRNGCRVHDGSRLEVSGYSNLAGWAKHNAAVDIAALGCGYLQL